jgi:hypothetical protein
MKQPLPTRCFKPALARVQHLFVDTPGVHLTRPLTPRRWRVSIGRYAGSCFEPSPNRVFLSNALRGVSVRRASDSVPVED